MTSDAKTVPAPLPIKSFLKNLYPLLVWLLLIGAWQALSLGRQNVIARIGQSPSFQVGLPDPARSLSNR
jgi:hypothetical protein